MRHREWKVPCNLCCALLAMLAVPATTLADGGQYVDVTITNVTAGQILSPPVVVSHNDDVALFELGQPASAELAALAEDADSAGLVALLMSSPAVRDVAQGDGVIMPGESATVRVAIGGNKRLISFASMLVTTNDGFAAARGLVAERRGRVATMVPAYDAGSEANNELCAFIPGPPCGNPFVRDEAGAEGYVYVHPGIQRVGDLDGASDWRNPVARVEIVPARDFGHGDDEAGDDDDDDDGAMLLFDFDR